MEEAAKELVKNMNDYESAVQQQQNDLNDKIDDLISKTDSSIKSYEEKSADIVSKIDSMYNQMITEAGRKLEEQETAAAERISTFKNDIQEAQCH